MEFREEPLLHDPQMTEKQEESAKRSALPLEQAVV
jgi:hypothetical protein